MEKCSVKVSVITVCLNAEQLIEKTIRSVACQNCNDYEYIILDGLSKDGTVETAHKYEGYFRKKGISYRIYSESDNGIYDAMNNSIQYAEGEWVIFMNAGDAFFDRNVLSKVCGEMTDSADVVYGDVVIQEGQRYKFVQGGGTEEFHRKNPIHHQASFTRAELLRRYPFDTSYKIMADYNLFLKLYRDQASFKKIDTVVATYLLGGLSHKHFICFQKEMHRAQVENQMENSPKLWKLLVQSTLFFTARGIGNRFMKPIFYAKSRGWSTDKHEAESLGRV